MPTSSTPPPPNAQHARRRRRGGIYVIVLGVSMIVSVLALGAMMVRRIERRTGQQTGDQAEARLYAQAAIEMGRLRIKNDANWRNTYTHGVWEADKPVGSGTYTLEGTDPADADLSYPETDCVNLIGTGCKGLAVQKLQVTLVPEIRGLTCLEASLHAANDLIINQATVYGDQMMSANNTIQSLNGSTIFPASESVNGFGGPVGPGTATTPIDPRSMPDPASVFDEYVREGTPILISTIPLVAGYHTIEKVVISPTSNPYGTRQTNSKGVYVIDCQGQFLDIRDSRIVGTLVFLNIAPFSFVYGSLNWEPAVANYPSLMVDGSTQFFFSSSPLDETTLTANFNPAGTPYLGQEDVLLDDVYPSRIAGLVYVSGDVCINRLDNPFDGVFVVGNSLHTEPGADLRLSYQPTFLLDPPPGFEVRPIPMKISPGSWKRVVDAQ
jgi:hypothetical protein